MAKLTMVVNVITLTVNDDVLLVWSRALRIVSARLTSNVHVLIIYEHDHCKGGSEPYIKVLTEQYIF